jgi:hypothetical protein
MSVEPQPQTGGSGRFRRSGDIAMHVHGNQLNPNAALDAAYAAQKAAANREAAETRKKLTEFASKLSGESDAFVARSGDEDEPSKEPMRRNSQKDKREKGRRQQSANVAAEGSHISDWA